MHLWIEMLHDFLPKVRLHLMFWVEYSISSRFWVVQSYGWPSSFCARCQGEGKPRPYNITNWLAKPVYGRGDPRGRPGRSRKNLTLTPYHSQNFV